MSAVSMLNPGLRIDALFELRGVNQIMVCVTAEDAFVNDVDADQKDATPDIPCVSLYRKEWSLSNCHRLLSSSD